MSSTPHCDALLVDDLDQQRLPTRTALAVLERGGFCGVLVHFGAGSDPLSLAQAALARQPRLVVLFVHFDHLLAENLALARTLRRFGVSAHVTITGPLPAMAADDLLEACPALDSVLAAEAGAGVADLLGGLTEGRVAPAVPGLICRSASGLIARAPAPGPLALDVLPSPVRGALPVVPGTGWGYAVLEASRGCYHACAFCLPCAFYRATYPSAPYRLRSIPSVLDEIAHLYARGARLFMFDDEQFLPPGPARGARVAELARGFAQRGMRVAFTIKCRPDDIEEGLLESLQQAGLVRVFVGVESGHDPTLALFQKGNRAAQSRRTLAALSARGIPADFRILAFHPWATRQTFARELEFLERVCGDLMTPISFHDVVCYPGTRLGERLRRERPPRPGCASRAAPMGGALRDYTIADPPVEVLRRLNRLVFGQREEVNGIHERITIAWYRVLLHERLESPPQAAHQRTVLRSLVLRLNHETLALWREMLEFVSTGTLRSDDVNRKAALWSMHARQSEHAALEALEDAGLTACSPGS